MNLTIYTDFRQAESDADEFARTRRSGGGAAVIRVERCRVYPSVARRGPAWKWVYNCVGPDGRRFDNDSVVTLRDVLRRAYPGVEIVEPWKVG